MESLPVDVVGETDTKRKREGLPAEVLAEVDDAPLNKQQRSGSLDAGSLPAEEAAAGEDAAPTRSSGSSATLNGSHEEEEQPSTASSSKPEEDEGGASEEAGTMPGAPPPGPDAPGVAPGPAALLPPAVAAAAAAAAAGMVMVHQLGQPVSGGLGPGGVPYERTEKVECPQTLVGRLIGKQGETIKDLQRRSGARIQIDQNFPEGTPRIVTVEGSNACVEIGCELVRSLIGNSPAVGGGNGQPGQMTTMECPKQLVGRVIGKGGETINELQRRSGARIQIEQRVSDGAPCVIEIQGDDACVQEAVRLTQEVMSGRRLESTAPAIGNYPYGAPPPMQQQHPGGYPGAPPGGDPYGGAMYAGDPYAAMHQHQQQQMAMYSGGDPYAAQQAQQQQFQQYQQYQAQYAAQVAYAQHQHHQQQQQQQQQQQPQQQQPPADAAAAPSPPGEGGWTSHSDGQNRTYWHNALTHESTWETPPGH